MYDIAYSIMTPNDFLFLSTILHCVVIEQRPLLCMALRTQFHFKALSITHYISSLLTLLTEQVSLLLSFTSKHFPSLITFLHCLRYSQNKCPFCSVSLQSTFYHSLHFFIDYGTHRTSVPFVHGTAYYRNHF